MPCFYALSTLLPKTATVAEKA